jgi:hypothetical protein
MVIFSLSEVYWIAARESSFGFAWESENIRFWFKRASTAGQGKPPPPPQPTKGLLYSFLLQNSGSMQNARKSC